MKTTIKLTSKSASGFRRPFALRGIAAALSILACAGVTAALAPRAAIAQDSPNISKTVSLNLKNASVQTALEDIFKKAGINYIIDPDVQGYVNLNITNVSFDTALRSLLSATNPPLTYSIDTGGIYHVKVKVAVQPNLNPNGSNPPGTATATEASHYFPLHLAYYDARAILQAIVGGTIQVIQPNTITNSGNAAGGAGGGAGGGFGGGGLGGGGLGGGGLGGGGFGGGGLGGGGFGGGGGGGFGGGGRGGF